MGKRGRAPKGPPNQLLQIAEKGSSELFAKSLVTKRVRIGKKTSDRGKHGHVREGLVRRSENEVLQKDRMRDVSWQIDVIFPQEHVQCIFYVLDFLQPDGTPYFTQNRPIAADPSADESEEYGVKEWTLELIPDEDSAELKSERKRELEIASASLYFKGGCAPAKALVAESGEEALLNQRISFWWPYEQEWYAGVVENVQVARDRQSARMTVQFDDGDVLTRSITGSIWRLESTDPTHENRVESLVKPLAPPSLQEAVRPHNLKALYTQSSIQVEQGDQKSLYVCTVETGSANRIGTPADVQVGTTSAYTVAIIDQADKAAQRKREYVFVLPEPVSTEGMQATIAENGKVRVSVPVRKQ
eukprot:jgi/Ulvmu1/5602/UM023_0139.1